MSVCVCVLYFVVHGRGAPEVPESLALGAQCLTRFNILEELCSRPPTGTYLSALVLKRNYEYNFHPNELLIPHLGNSIGQKPFAQKVQPLPWGDSGPVLRCTR